MNIEYIEYHLKEALKQIQETLKEISQNTDIKETALMIKMEHIYNHLNSAWNARNSSIEEAQECSDENFTKWRNFPTDIDLMIDTKTEIQK
jgi:ATP-dependent Lon protease